MALGETFLSSFSFWRLQVVLGLWLPNSSLCPLFTESYTLCVSSFLSLISILVIGLGLTWIMQSDLILRFLIISANSLFPNKVTLQILVIRMWTYLWQGAPFYLWDSIFLFWVQDLNIQLPTWHFHLYIIGISNIVNPVILILTAHLYFVSTFFLVAKAINLGIILKYANSHTPKPSLNPSKFSLLDSPVSWIQIHLKSLHFSLFHHYYSYMSQHSLMPLHSVMYCNRLITTLYLYSCPLLHIAINRVL